MDAEEDGGFGRHAANVTVYSHVARAGPHRANGLTVLEFIDSVHRELTKAPDKGLTKGG